MSNLQRAILALFHALILLPLSAILVVILHLLDHTSRQGKSRVRTWPIRRLSTWALGETMAVAIVTHLLAVCTCLEQLPFTPPMEMIIPRLSKLALGVRHQGWQIQCESVMIPSIPAQENDRIGKLSAKTTTSDRPIPRRVDTEEALPFSLGLSSLLRGYISHDTRTTSSSPAMWLWKTQASHVKQGEVIAVRSNSKFGGLGCGPAENGEKVILLLAGSGLDENGPLVGPLAWTITRQSGLRMLIVKIRKMRKGSTVGAFPASLQDALAGYAYLVERLGFLSKNITLLGEGIGASLCVSLALYLSALNQVSGIPVRIDRPGKLLLYSPWCDMTVSPDVLRENCRYDVVDLTAQLEARRRLQAGFLRMVGEDVIDKLISDLVSRYQQEEEDKIDLELLGTELADTVETLGWRHPLVSPGMPTSCNEYTRLAMQLLGAQSGSTPLEILICAGSAEAHITEARSLAANLSSVEGIKVEYIEGEDKVTNFSFVTASPANSKVDEISQAFLHT